MMALSTEELMAAVHEVNKLDNTKEENENLDLFSMDIEKMYPSADMDDVCRGVVPVKPEAGCEHL